VVQYLLAILGVACALSLAANGAAMAHELRPTPAQAHQHEQEARGLTADLRQRGLATTQKAQRRNEILKQLAESLPSAVIDMALTPNERANLPAIVQPLVETWEDETGELRVLHIDDEDGHSRYDIALVQGNRSTPLKIGHTVRGVRPGDLVKVKGVKLAGENHW
jgi:hypothetical protein